MAMVAMGGPLAGALTKCPWLLPAPQPISALTLPHVPATALGGGSGAASEVAITLTISWVCLPCSNCNNCWGRVFCSAAPTYSEPSAFPRP